MPKNKMFRCSLVEDGKAHSLHRASCTQEWTPKLTVSQRKHVVHLPTPARVVTVRASRATKLQMLPDSLVGTLNRAMSSNLQRQSVTSQDYVSLPFNTLMWSVTSGIPGHSSAFLRSRLLETGLSVAHGCQEQKC